MIRFIARIVLTAVLFCFILPAISSGVQFHGDFWPTGIIYSAVFAIVAAAVGYALIVGIGVFAVGTAGLGLLIVAPVLIFGFWLIPALQLQVMAHYFPEQFTVASWGSAIWAGLLLMVVNTICSKPKREQKAK